MKGMRQVQGFRGMLDWKEENEELREILNDFTL